MSIFHRRALLGGLPAAGLLVALPAAAEARPNLRAAIARFVALEGSKSFRIDVGENGRIFRQSYKAVRPMFIGSAVKTFILTRYLQEVERGNRTLGEYFTVDDRVRSLSSPVLEHMHGRFPARSVLEAMITHSDNTATDIALKAVGVETVRAFLREHRYDSVLVPGSTRVMFSYLAGAPDGVDKGWKGMEQIMADRLFGEPRPAINPVQSMMGTTNDLVTYYQRALRGDYFARPDTLTEFRRIQAMASALAPTVPAGVAAYGKGGSVDWEGFHAFCLPGQMVLGRAGVAPLPVTFCFTYNWSGPEEGVPAAFSAYVASVTAILAQITRLFG
ncbi:serine hydrolase [Geminicoccus flavidas]|uniref:serine hydrolase n=1 Tax=Geminicoccus flavidas TaxID=2506407 RepID=UPI001359B389|nr:serine hydrolase [Geminicoccus flavidas]